MTPAELVDALEANGVAVSPVRIGERDAFLASKLIGDIKVERIMLDLPVRVPGSMRVAFCRDFDIPLKELAVTAHEL